MAGPLTGIKVLEMAHVISGPYAGALLADLGAEVTKVEMPGQGDYFRAWDAQDGAIRPPFAAYNRGKKSVTVNIQTDEGRELYLRLARETDAIIENFRPGALDKYGIGYEALSEINPRLIYCAISGMGATGPYSRRPTYDQIAQAMSGLWSQLTDMADPDPVGPAICDQLTGMNAAYAVLGALVGRSITGKGQKVELSMLSSGIAFSPAAISDFTMEGNLADKSSRAHGSQSYAFAGSDGKPFAIHLSTPQKFWEGVCNVAGRPDLIEDERFSTKRARMQNYDVLRGELMSAFSTKPRDEWLHALEEADVPSGPLYNIAETLSDPQVEHLGLLRTFGEGDRAMDLLGFPWDYSGTPCEPGLPPPLLGEHTAEVLTALGYTPEQQRAMAETGAI